MAELETVVNTQYAFYGAYASQAQQFDKYWKRSKGHLLYMHRLDIYNSQSYPWIPFFKINKLHSKMSVRFEWNANAHFAKLPKPSMRKRDWRSLYFAQMLNDQMAENHFCISFIQI